MKGISIAAVLGIIFIVLRLCKVIAWSWLWVLAPFWAPSPIAFVILIIALGYKRWRDRRNK